MKSHSTQALLGIGTVAFAVVVAAIGSFPLAIGMVSMAVLAFVAFSTQSERLRDEKRLVYRPVYVRRHDVQRRVTSDD